MVCLISRNINAFFDNNKLRPTQVRLKARSHQFLRQDSYLNCNELNEALPSELLEAERRGSVNSEERKAIITAILCAPGIERRYKGMIATSDSPGA